MYFGLEPMFVGFKFQLDGLNLYLMLLYFCTTILLYYCTTVLLYYLCIYCLELLGAEVSYVVEGRGGPGGGLSLHGLDRRKPHNLRLWGLP